MMFKELALAVEKEIRRLSDADDFSFHMSESETIETRFAQNRITQHMGKVMLKGSISLEYGNRSGSVSTNDFSLERIPLLLAQAKEMAMLTQPDLENVRSQPYCELKPRTNSFDSVLKLTNEEMTDIVGVSIKRAEKANAMISGMTEKTIYRSYMTSKNGFTSSEEFASFGHSMTMKRENAETKLSIDVLKMEQFNLEAELDKLEQQLNDLTEPVSMDARPIAVILRPQAVDNLFQWLYWMMDRRQADEGFTPFTGQAGTKFFGDKFNLYSTDQVEGLFVPESVGEMEPFKPITYIENGVIRNMPTSRYWAKEKGLEYIPYPANFVISGGDTTEEEMMKMVPEGLIINNFWYLRNIDSKRGEITGMTRDGVLYFKDGKIQHSVNNFRFNEIPHEVTRRILALGKAEQRSVQAILPTMLIDEFVFVDKSTF
jgi:predicted Zn-dependent protease